MCVSLFTLPVRFVVFASRLMNYLPLLSSLARSLPSCTTRCSQLVAIRVRCFVCRQNRSIILLGSFCSNCGVVTQYILTHSETSKPFIHLRCRPPHTYAHTPPAHSTQTRHTYRYISCTFHLFRQSGNLITIFNCTSTLAYIRGTCDSGTQS